jgi:hypothetical protein
MTSIPLILHYQPTLHLLTNLIQFCLILPEPYILAQNLNPPGPYILGRREYSTVFEQVWWIKNVVQKGNIDNWFLTYSIIGTWLACW